MDALGKPPSYDPRQDSQVRIQVDRLRQKLAEYYRSEGTHDQIVVKVPKGHFMLQARLGPQQEIEVNEPAPPAPMVNEWALPTRWRRIILAMGAILVSCVVWVFYITVEFWSDRQPGADRIHWTSDMDDLWRPLIDSHRPLLVSVAAPLFIGLQGAGLYRDLSANTWEEALNSPKVAAVRRGMHHPKIESRYYYTGFGTMSAIFQLGKLLARRDVHVSLVKSSELSWQQLSVNNVILVDPPRLLAEQTRNLPTELELTLEGASVRILHPAPGQPAKALTWASEILQGAPGRGSANPSRPSMRNRSRHWHTV